MNTRSLIAKGIAFPITAIALLPLPLFSTPTLTQNPVPCSVVAGSPATLSCLATGATSYQWTKNGLPIPGANDSKLTFDKTNLADSGTYRVIAKDGTGQMISNPAALLITKPWDAPCVFCLNLVEAPPTDSKQVLADEAQKSAATFLGDDKPQVVAGPPPLGHAWDFAQTKGIIKVATSPLLSSIGDVTTTSGLTLAFWFNKAHPARFLRLAGFAPCFEIATGKGFNITFGDGKNMANLDLAFPGELTDGHWHHIAITLDFTRTTDNVALYLDGKKTTHFSRTFDKSFSSRANLIIGGRSAMGDHVMQAQLAQFALFNHGLDESEVDDLFKTGTVHSYSPIVKVLPNSNRVVLPQNQLTILGDISGPPSSPSQGNWSKVSGPGAVTFSDAGRPSTIASFSVAGDYLLRFSLPSVPHSITRDIAIKVASNEPPVALASVNHSKVSLVPTSVKLTGGGTDDGLPENPGRLSYLWTQVSGPGSATFAAPTDEITTASLPQSAPGDYVFRLTANDGETANSTEVHVAVVSNLPPVATAISSRPIIDFTEGAANTFDLGCRANDDGFPAKPGRLSYSWSALGENAASLSFDKPDQPNVQATAKAPGTYQVRVAVSDGELSTTANVWLKAVPASVSKFVHSPDYVEPFSSNPPPFVHPRLFFTEEDRAALAEKAKNDPLIAQSVKQMEEVIKTSIDDPTSIVGQAYAQFATGNYHYDFRALYPSLENPVSLSGAKGDIYTALSAACYLAWLDQSDPKKLRELATVVANLARCHALVFVPNPEKDRNNHGGLDHEVFVDLGFCYDLMYNWMTEDERQSCRSLISGMTTAHHSMMWNSYDADISTNWRDGTADVLTTSLAIEGEPGFDAETTADNTKAIKIFVSKWGINEEGFNREGPGYFSLGMQPGALAAYAASRRDENFFVTANLYQCPLEMFYCLAPDMNSMLGHGDAEGWNNANGVTSIYDVLKGVYPKDVFTDYVYRNFMKDKMANNFPLIRAIFGRDVLPGNDNTGKVAEAKGISLDVRSMQRGFASSRSDWSSDALRLDFDDRFDAFFIGHMKTNRNSFYLYSHGRSWITDAGYHSVHNDLHSTVLIDQLGEAGTSIKPCWPSFCGRFLESISTPLFSLNAGDAKASYAYTFQDISNDPRGNVATPGSKATEYRWSDFFPSGFQPPSAINGDNMWMNNVINVKWDLYNPVQRAFRTVILARGKQPYVLVFDDIQKDDQPHTYAWSANTNEGQGDMEVEPGATATDGIFFRQVDSDPKKPRLLVRVLSAQGETSPVALDTTPCGDVLSRRIRIQRDHVIAPDFRVMLVPHLDGEALPTTSYENNILTVKTSDGVTDVWKFAPNEEKRTRLVSFTRNGGSPPSITLPQLDAATASTQTSYGSPAAVVNYAPTATDSSGGAVTTVCQPPSGSLFVQGETPVVVTAMDSAGNVSSAVFRVVVK